MQYLFYKFLKYFRKLFPNSLRSDWKIPFFCQRKNSPVFYTREFHTASKGPAALLFFFFFLILLFPYPFPFFSSVSFIFLHHHLLPHRHPSKIALVPRKRKCGSSNDDYSISSNCPLSLVKRYACSDKHFAGSKNVLLTSATMVFISSAEFTSALRRMHSSTLAGKTIKSLSS